MDKQHTNNIAMPATHVSSQDVYAADLFSRLSPNAQKAIIDLIKSLLSGK